MSATEPRRCDLRKRTPNTDEPLQRVFVDPDDPRRRIRTDSWVDVEAWA